MNKYLSIKLKAISFILTVMVVFIHSTNHDIEFTNKYLVLKKGYSIFIQEFLSGGLARIAVPLFFIFSGYLFFLNFNGTFREFKTKINKRIVTLVVPYLFWSIFGLLIYYLLQIIPQSANFFTNKLIKDYSISELINLILIQPVQVQLWFIRDLMAFVILSPIIYFLAIRLKYISIFVLFIAWFVNFDFLLFNNESILFFVIGATLNANNGKLILVDFSKKYWIYLIVWLALVFGKTFLEYQNFNNEIMITIIHKISILVGILAVWSLYDFIYGNENYLKIKSLSILSFSFFIFVFHEPTLDIVKKGLFYFMGNAEFISLLIYFAAAIITIIISIFIGQYLKRFVPKFYAIITGGR